MIYRAAIVDDEPPVRRHLQNALRKEGYEVESFGEADAFR